MQRNRSGRESQGVHSPLVGQQSDSAADRTPLQLDELEALTGDRAAVLSVVSALRRYRELVNRIAKARYADGEVDGATLASLLSEVSEIEGEA